MTGNHFFESYVKVVICQSMRFAQSVFVVSIWTNTFTSKPNIRPIRSVLVPIIVDAKHTNVHMYIDAPCRITHCHRQSEKFWLEIFHKAANNKHLPELLKLRGPLWNRIILKCKMQTIDVRNVQPWCVTGNRRTHPGVPRNNSNTFSRAEEKSSANKSLKERRYICRWINCVK